jgi:DNA polymerase-3 subunit epsilon
VVDCQTTGSRPADAAIMEIGWQITALDSRWDRPGTQSARLINSPALGRLPPAIQRLTGLSPSDFDGAGSARSAWSALTAAAAQAARTKAGRAVTVVHYARFESAFLRRLHAQTDPNGGFPLELVCTHELVKRLLPDLPRKGLRAVAGFLGHSVPSLKRCADHVVATALIWRHCVARLETDFGIETLEALGAFLQRPITPTPGPRRYPLQEKGLPPLPPKPGVYHFMRANGDLLYVGKAAALKTRVASYFQPSRRHPEHILEMLTQAARVAIHPTGSALEAALEEADHIKRLSPPYNIALRAGQRHLWYTDRRWRRWSDQPDAGCRIGPIPDKALAIAMTEIRRRVRSRGGSAARALATADPQAPSQEIFEKGWAQFRKRHEGCLGTDPPALMGLARAIWRQRREAAPEPADESEPTAAAPFQWDAETVADALEGVVCRYGHMVRRARWFAILHRAVVVWRSRDDPAAIHALSACFGPVHPFRIFGGPATLAGYDRARVMTTELRRLSGENRLVGIFLGRRATMNGYRLRRLLGWL